MRHTLLALLLLTLSIIPSTSEAKWYAVASEAATGELDIQELEDARISSPDILSNAQLEQLIEQILKCEDPISLIMEILQIELS